MDDERMRILKMIENGQVSAEEGARLLDAVSETASVGEGAPDTGKPRWLRVRVTDMRTGKRKVNVNLPMALVNVGMKVGARFAPEMEGMDMDEVMNAIKEGAQGKIADVEDEEGGERVEIYVE